MSDPASTLMCEADVANKDFTANVTVDTVVDCFLGKDNSTGAGIKANARQYDLVHTGPEGGSFEMRGASAMKPPGRPRQKDT